MSRVRVRFSKTGKVRWTSHRDVARMWERAFRRAALPLEYSGGFSPRPKVSFGLALPTGYESVAEYLDVELAEASGVDVHGLPARLSAGLPPGVEATAAAVIPPGTPSLQEDVVSCSWRWLVEAPEGCDPLDGHQLGESVASVLAATSVVVTCARKGGAVEEDIRPGVIDLRIAESSQHPGTWVEAELACRPRLFRPSEVTAALGGAFEERQVRRTHQWILRAGSRAEPLDAALRPAVADAPRALEHAS